MKRELRNRKTYAFYSPKRNVKEILLKHALNKSLDDTLKHLEDKVQDISIITEGAATSTPKINQGQLDLEEEDSYSFIMDDTVINVEEGGQSEGQDPSMARTSTGPQPRGLSEGFDIYRWQKNSGSA